MPDLAVTYPYRAKLSAMLSRKRPSLEELAAEVEEVCPKERSLAKPTVILDSEFDKITDVPPETDMDAERERVRGRMAEHMATLRYTFEDVFVWPGGFSTRKGLGLNFRPPQARALLSADIPHFEKGYFGASWIALRYFGHWVKDGLPALLLAKEDERIVFPSEAGWWHAEPLLKMTGIERIEAPYAHFDRLSFAFDVGHNSSKRARVAEIRRRVMTGLGEPGHERVYLKRGKGGAARGLLNEDALIAALEGRGFAILSSDEPAETLMPKLNGVKTLVSIEGSHSAAAFLAIAEDGVMLSISPADRFNTHHNDWSNTIGFTFAAAVAERQGEGHVADVDAVLRTIDAAEAEAAKAKPAASAEGAP